MRTAKPREDPFDHLLIAQAIPDELTFVSYDVHTPKYLIIFLAGSE